MVAAFQALRMQEIRNLVGTARQRGERQLCLAVAAGINDPQRRAVAALRVLRELRIEPVQRPVEGYRIGPTESLYGGLVIRAMLKQKRARFLKGGHQVIPSAPYQAAKGD
jgi:hypothetical protein